MAFFKLTEVRAAGSEPTRLICVASDVRDCDLSLLSRAMGDELHFQIPSGKVVGKCDGISVCADGQAILRASITDELTKTYCAEGDLTGVSLSAEYELAICDRPLGKADSFLFRDYTGQLAKSFKPPKPVEKMGIERYGYRASQFPGLGYSHPTAASRNGLTREEQAHVYAVQKAATLSTKAARGRSRVNPNQRLTE
jgi:hypothetical protein